MINRARQMFPEMADLPDNELMGAIHAAYYPDMSKEEFDKLTAPKSVTKTTYNKLTGPMPDKIIMVLEDGTAYVIDYRTTDPVAAVESIIEGMDEDITQDEPQLDFITNNVPVDENRLNFEIGLIKNKKTSKKAILLPPETTPQQARKIAQNARLQAIKQGDEIYLFDPGQIAESTLRNQIKSGKNGLALGYGTDSVPENGVPYAIDLDGYGTTDPQEILQLRDSGRLGFSGMAPDMETALVKIREMGRDDQDS